ncbi:MAG: hypothetical protein ACK416_01340 [Zestosphaera sp.]
MNSVAIATSFLVVMIFLVIATSLWLAPNTPLTINVTETTNTTYMTEYGIILRFKGDKPVIDGKEICKDVVGSIIIKFGNEFQSIDVCEFIEEGVIHIFFSEGVRYWIETLEECRNKNWDEC